MALLLQLLHPLAEPLRELVRLLLEKAPDESVLTIQAEEGFPLDELPGAEAWDVRKYGRNLLLLYVVSRTMPETGEKPPDSAA